MQFPNWLITTIGKRWSIFFRNYLKYSANLQLTDLQTMKTHTKKISILSTGAQVHLM